MLAGFIYCLIYLFIEELLEKAHVNKIKRGVSVNTAIRSRKKIKLIRRISFLVCIIAALVTQYLINGEVSTWTIWPVSFMCLILLKKNVNSPYGNFSYLSIEDIQHSDKEFILFLRGFERDNYNAAREMEKKIRFKNFSEFHLIKCLRKKLNYNFYAVGMTKEIESPFGADRVYLSDYSWKQDVKWMMEKAVCIIVEINDKPSCIWEIEQCNKYPFKTFFIITDKEKYRNVYYSTIEKLPITGKGFPHPNNVKSLLCFTFPDYGIKNEFEFENHIDSYNKLSQKIAYRLSKIVR